MSSSSQHFTAAMMRRESAALSAGGGAGLGGPEITRALHIGGKPLDVAGLKALREAAAAYIRAHAAPATVANGCVGVPGKSFAQVLTDIGLPVLSNQEALDLLGSRLQRRKAADERKAGGGGRGKGGAEAAEKDDPAADEADDPAEAASPGEAAAGAVGPSAAAEADKDGAATAAAPASSVALDPDHTYVRIHGARSADRDITVGAALKLLLAIDAQLLSAAAATGGVKASSPFTEAIPSSAAYNTAVNSSKPLHSAFPLPWGVYRSMEHIAVERCAQQYLDDAATVIPVVRAASDAQEAWAAFFKAYRKQQAAAERGATQNDDDEDTAGKGSRRPRASPEERAAQQKKSLLLKKGFSARSDDTAATATDSPSAATESALGTKLAWHDDAVLTAVYLFLCSEGPATYELLATGTLPLDPRVDSTTETRSQQERDDSPWSVEHDDWNKAMPLARAALIRFTLSAGLHGVVKALPLGPTNPCSHIRIPPFNSKVFPLATVLDKAFAHPSATNILRIAAYAASGYKTARECVKCKVFDLLADVLYKRPGEVDAVNASLAVAKAIGGQVRFMDAEIFGFAVQNHVHHPATAAAAWAMLGTLETVPVDTATGVAVQISYKSIVAAIDVVLRAGNPVSLRGRAVGQSLAGDDGDAHHRGAASSSSSATPCLDTVAGALVVIWGHIDSLSETPRNIAAKLASQDTIHSLLHLIALSRHASRLPLWNVYAESIQTNAVKIIVAVFSRWANFDGSRGELPAARQSRRGGGGRDMDDVDTGSTILVSQAILQRMWPLLDATKFAEETVAHIALMLTKFFALVPPHVASSAVELIEQSYCTLRLSAPADAVCITDFLSMASTVDSRAAKVLVALATQDHHADGAWSVAAIETIRSSALNVTSDAEDAQLSRADAQAAPTEGIAKTVEFGASVSVILTAALTQAEAQTLPLVFSCARAVLKRFDGVHGKLIAHGAFSGLLLRLENWLSGEESLDDSPNEINPAFLQGHGVSVPLSLPAGAMVLVDMLTRQHIIDAPIPATTAAAATVVGGAVSPGAESATSNAGSAAAEDTHARVHELAVMLGWAFHPESPFAHGSGGVSGSAASPWILDERKAGTITVAQHRAHLQGQLLSALTNVLSAGTSLAAFEAAAKEDLTQAHLLSAHKRIDRSHHKALEKLLRGIGVDESKFPSAAATTTAGAGGKGAAEKEGKSAAAGGKATSSSATAASAADGASASLGRFANPFEALRAGGAATSSKNGATTGTASNGAKSGSSAAALKLSDAAVKAQNKALLAAGFSLVTTTSERRKAAKTKQAVTDASAAHKDARSTLRSAADGTRRRRDDDYDGDEGGYRLSHDAAGDDIVEYRRTVGPGGRTSVKAASARQSEHSRTAAATSSTTTKSKHHHDDEENDDAAAAPTSGAHAVVQQHGDTTITQVAGVTIRQRTALPVTLAPHLMAPPPQPAPAAVAARPERGAKSGKRGGKDDGAKPAATSAPSPPTASAETFSWAGRARLTIQREEEERQRRIDEEIAAKEAVRRAARQEVENQYHAARAATREDEKAVRGRLRAELDAGYDRIRARDRERAVEEEKKKIEMLKKMTSGSRNTSSTSPPAATAPPAASASSKLTEMFRKILPGSATINGEPQQQQQHVGGAAPAVPAAHGGTASQHPHARGGGAASHHSMAGDSSSAATHDRVAAARSAPGGSRGLFGRAEASPPPATAAVAPPAATAPPPPVVAPTATVQPAGHAPSSAAAATGPTGLLPSWHTAQDYSTAQTAYRQQQQATATTTAAAVPSAEAAYQVNEKQLKQMLERYYQTAQSPAAAPAPAVAPTGFGSQSTAAAAASMYQQPLGAGAYGTAPTSVAGSYGGTPAAPWATTAQQQQLPHSSAAAAAGFGGGAQPGAAAGSSAASAAVTHQQQQQLMQAYYQQQQAAYAAAALYGSQAGGGVSGGVQQASHAGGYGQTQGQPSQYHGGGGHHQSQRSAAPHHHTAAPPHHPHHAQHGQQLYPQHQQHGYGGVSQPQQQHVTSYGGGAAAGGQYGQHVPQQPQHRGGAAPGASSAGYGAPGAMYGGGAQGGAFTGAAGTWATPAASGAGGLSHGYGSGGMWSGMAGGAPTGANPQGGSLPQGGGYAPPQQQSQQGFGGTFGGYQGGYGGR